MNGGGPGPGIRPFLIGVADSVVTAVHPIARAFCRVSMNDQGGSGRLRPTGEQPTMPVPSVK
jgi:hypothetical protein